jgi:choice-of-anchor A domain-containing protein
LIVAKNLEFNGGSIHGNTVVGGNFTSNYSGSIYGNVSVGGTLNAANGISASSVTTYGAVNGYQNWYPTHTTGSGSFNLGFDFAAQQTRLTLLSASIDSYATTGTATLNYSTLVFNATNSNGINIFDIEAADALKNMQITGLGAAGTVLINVHGNIVNFGNHGFTGFDTARGRILFNLAEATQASAGYVEGSVLAPKATFTGNGGVIWGQVVTNNWESSTQVNNAPFIGSIPVPAVPEPETAAMLLAGLGLLAATARRRKAN